MLKKVRHSQTALFSNDAGIINAEHLSTTPLSQTYLSKISALESVIKKLREDDLKRGYCFMVFDENLPEEEAYYEYPDGTIRIERLDKQNLDIPRAVIKTLSKSEATAVRRRHALFS